MLRKIPGPYSNNNGSKICLYKVGGFKNILLQREIELSTVKTGRVFYLSLRDFYPFCVFLTDKLDAEQKKHFSSECFGSIITQKKYFTFET